MPLFANRKPNKLEDPQTLIKNNSLAASMIILEQAGDAPGGPFNVDIGRTPAHMEDGDYIAQMHAGTVEHLARTSLEGTVAFSHACYQSQAQPAMTLVFDRV